jgi:glycosyltransferase involved in cell wall biosynthesis
MPAFGRFALQSGVSSEVDMKRRHGHRILMLLENCSYPEDTRVLQEAQALAADGYEVAVICPKEAGQRWHECADGVHLYRYPAPPAASSLLTYLWEYGYTMAATFLLSLWVLGRQGFDVVHLHSPPDIFVAIAAFYKMFGKRFVFDHHDLSAEMYTMRFENGGNRLVYQTLLWLEKCCFRLADHVISTNHSYKTIAMQRGEVPEARITIVRNGPDIRMFKPVVPHPAMQSIGQQDKTILAYVGVMGFQDGVDYFLRALRHLVYDLKRTNVYAVLLGQGDAFASLQALAQQLNLDDYLRFAGWTALEEVPHYLSAADICVAPEPSNAYTDRSTTIKLMEYMAVGKPTVAFALPEHQFSAQDAALYAQPNEELDFARHIAVLMDDPIRRQRMGQRGLERITTELAWSYQAKHLIEAYTTLMRGRVTRPTGSPA